MSTSGMPQPPRMPGRSSGSPARTSRRNGLTRDAVVDAAMAIVDTEGLDALTMRAVAARLGVGVASLYAHVGSKDDLVDLLIDRAIGEMPFPPETGDWKEQMKAVAIGMREAWTRHGDLARASFSHVPLGENSMTGVEAMLASLRAGGLSDRVAGLAGDLLALYVGATAYEDSLEAGLGMDQEQWHAYAGALGDYFAALPRDRFPNLTALSGALTTGEVDRFEFGLDVILEGLEAVDRKYKASS